MPMRTKTFLLPVMAIVLVLLVMVLPARALAESSLDYVWGHKPNIRIEGAVNLSEEDQLRSGEWFQIVYDIRVSKYIWEGDDVVKKRVVEHLEKIIGQTIHDHPEIRIYYAEYHCYKVENNFILQNYYYHAKIIGHVEPLQLKGSTKLVAPAIVVAVIIGLITAAIIATIVLVNQPAVQKLIVATGNAIENTAANPLFPYILYALLGAFAVYIIATSILLITKK